MENAKEHKDKNAQKSRRRRIRRVIVESDVSSTEEDDAEFENDATSDSSDEEYEEEVYGKNKRVSSNETGLTLVHSYSTLATSSWSIETPFS